ncbi:MAG TPA: PEGA domain-containing protein [Kofleriaceae bacterium]
MWRWPVKRFAILALSLALTGTAIADDKAAAEAYFRNGAKAYAAQNFLAAAQNFDEAYKAAPLPEIAFSAAQAYRRLYAVDSKPEYVKRAVELYKAYLAVTKQGGRVGVAADNLRDMQRELDRLNITNTTIANAPAKTRIGVSITLADQRAGDTDTLREIGDATGTAIAPNLEATLDGQPVEPFALIDVDAKEHVITVSADGYAPVEKKKVAVSGISSLVEVELQPEPAQVSVRTESGASLVVDGRAVATTPTAALQLPAGKHLLTVLHRGREPYGKELLLMRGQPLTVDAPLQKTGKRRAVPWTVGGAGVLALGAIATGIGAGVEDGKADDIRADLEMGNRPPSDADAYDHHVSKRDDYVTATWVLGGAAVAAGTVGILLYLFDQPSAESIHLEPVAGPGVAGVSLSGSL